MAVNAWGPRHDPCCSVLTWCGLGCTRFAGMWLKDWRKRWFVLEGNKLHFSKSPSVRSIDLSAHLHSLTRRACCRILRTEPSTLPHV